MVKVRNLIAPFIDVNVLPHESDQRKIKVVICSKIEAHDVNDQDIPGGYNYVKIILALDASSSAAGMYEIFEERKRPIEEAVNKFIESFASKEVVKEIDICFWATDPRPIGNVVSSVLPCATIDCSQEPLDVQNGDYRVKWDKSFWLNVIRPHQGSEMGRNVTICSLLDYVAVKAEALEAEVERRQKNEKPLVVTVVLATDYIRDEGKAKTNCSEMAKRMVNSPEVSNNASKISMVKFVLVQVARVTQPNVASQQQRFDDMFEGESGYPDLWTHILWQDFGEQGLKKPEWLWEAIFAELHSEEDAAIIGNFNVKYLDSNDTWLPLETPLLGKNMWPAKITLELPANTTAFQLIKDNTHVVATQKIPSGIISEDVDQVSCFIDHEALKKSIIPLNIDGINDNRIVSISCCDDSTALAKAAGGYDFSNSRWVEVCMNFLLLCHATSAEARIVLDAALLDNEHISEILADVQRVNDVSIFKKITVCIWNCSDKTEYETKWKNIPSVAADTDGIFVPEFCGKKDDLADFYSVFCNLDETLNMKTEQNAENQGDKAAKNTDYQMGDKQQNEANQGDEAAKDPDSQTADMQQDEENQRHVVTLFLFSDNGIPNLNFIIEESRLLVADKWDRPGSFYHMIIVDIDPKSDTQEHAIFRKQCNVLCDFPYGREVWRYVDKFRWRSVVRQCIADSSRAYNFMKSHSPCEIRGKKSDSEETIWIANLGHGIPEKFDFAIGKEFSAFQVVSYRTNEQGDEIQHVEFEVPLSSGSVKSELPPLDSNNSANPYEETTT